MTNREYMVKVLSDESLDPFDNGADGEALVFYNIACPYFEGDERAHCSGGKSIDRERCVACKLEWLENEVDT